MIVHGDYNLCLNCVIICSNSATWCSSIKRIMIMSLLSDYQKQQEKQNANAILNEEQSNEVTIMDKNEKLQTSNAIQEGLVEITIGIRAIVSMNQVVDMVQHLARTGISEGAMAQRQIEAKAETIEASVYPRQDKRRGKASERQLGLIHTLMAIKGITEENALREMGVSDFSEITNSKANVFIQNHKGTVRLGA